MHSLQLPVKEKFFALLSSFSCLSSFFFLYHESELVNNITILDFFTKSFIAQTKLPYVPYNFSLFPLV